MGSTASIVTCAAKSSRLRKTEGRRERQEGKRGEERRGSNVNKNKRNSGASANPSKAPSHCPRPPALLEKWLIRLLWCSYLRANADSVSNGKRNAQGNEISAYMHTHESPSALAHILRPSIPTVILIFSSRFLRSCVFASRDNASTRNAVQAVTPAFSPAIVSCLSFFFFSSLPFWPSYIRESRRVAISRISRERPRWDNFRVEGPDASPRGACNPSARARAWTTSRCYKTQDGFLCAASRVLSSPPFFARGISTVRGIAKIYHPSKYLK